MLTEQMRWKQVSIVFLRLFVSCIVSVFSSLVVNAHAAEPKSSLLVIQKDSQKQKNRAAHVMIHPVRPPNKHKNNTVHNKPYEMIDPNRSNVFPYVIRQHLQVRKKNDSPVKISAVSINKSLLAANRRRVDDLMNIRQPAKVIRLVVDDHNIKNKNGSPQSKQTSHSNITTPSSQTQSVQPLGPVSQYGKFSFNFQDIELRKLLQLISAQSESNFIISDSVKGNVTLNLKNVTWKQALDVILRSYGLASQELNNTILISTLEEMTANEAKRMKSEQDMANLAPLTAKLIKLKYMLSTDLANLLKGDQGSLLSPRGQIAIDPRTNSIILLETAENIKKITHAVTQLDIPAKQVLIEARIINVDTTFEQELGVKFGVSDTRHLSGTLSGANQLTQGTNVSGITPLDQRLNFNVPANKLFDGSTPGSIGLALARIGPVMLDLELSALEGEKHLQIIARPRVITSNQQKAVIETGEEIPYQEATSSGATSVVFKKAVLSLEIVPQITPNNKIVLKLKATEDTRGDNISTGNTTVPAINTQQVESNILLNNNDTIVLGGVYKQTKINTFDRIPFLGSLPIIGNLFKHTGQKDEKRELLIFITPKIIQSRNLS